MNFSFTFKADRVLGDRLDTIDRRIEAVDKRLESIGATLQGVKAQGVVMSQELDDLTAKVEETVIQLLNGLAGQIADLKNDPAALQALSNSLSSKSSELAAAIQANTPTESEPPANA
jgi:septal ring factor EnvC (AmiA/AmiB activator)